MAKIGLKNFLYAPISAETESSVTYGTAKKPAKAISCAVNITNSSTTLYADDALAESDSSFQSGTVTIGLDEEDLEVSADLLGHTYSSGEIVRNYDDLAPYVGIGRIITKIVDGEKKYKVEFLHKVKFAEPSQSDTTKGENIAFGTIELAGTVHVLLDGRWSTAKTFDSASAAQTYLEGLFA